MLPEEIVTLFQSATADVFFRGEAARVPVNDTVEPDRKSYRRVNFSFHQVLPSFYSGCNCEVLLQWRCWRVSYEIDQAKLLGLGIWIVGAPPHIDYLVLGLGFLQTSPFARKLVQFIDKMAQSHHCYHPSFFYLVLPSLS